MLSRVAKMIKERSEIALRVVKTGGMKNFFQNAEVRCSRGFREFTTKLSVFVFFVTF